MNQITEQENIKIENMIYEIRRKYVMFSSDVVHLYNVDTKVLNQTIKRNINRFSSDFCFQLEQTEAQDLFSRS